MTIYYNATDRKALVKAISEFTGAKAVYMKTPTYAYQIDYFTVTREGNLVFDDMADSEEIEKLIEALAQQGFIAESSEYDQPMPDIEVEEITEDCPPPYGTPDEITGMCISMPRSIFTDANLENLQNIIAAKRSLICKALGTEDLPLEISDKKVSFPWFPGQPDADSVKVYDTFICKLCEMARNQKRVSATEKTVDNEKYAFRCFLLRLGFIGNEYKTERKILLKNLTGSSAFKSGTKKEVSSDEVSE